MPKFKLFAFRININSGKNASNKQFIPNLTQKYNEMNISLFLIIFAIVTQQIAEGQFFGGVNRLPSGGKVETIGTKVGPAWGSLTQNTDHRGFTGPKISAGGLNLAKPHGGISGSFQHQAGVGGQVSLQGQATLINKPNHNLNAWVQVDRNLDKNFKIVGPQTNSGGINYQNKNGMNIFGSVSKTQGSPAVGSVGFNGPLYQSKDGSAKLSAQGQTTFGSGMKPQHSVGITFQKTF